MVCIITAIRRNYPITSLEKGLMLDNEIHVISPDGTEYARMIVR